VAERLRIAQIAPIETGIIPEYGGSIEQLVWLLTEELVRRGHEVTLFATGDSKTSAALHATYPRGYEDDDQLWNWCFHETLNAAAAFERAGDFDVIHSHAYHFALPFTRLVVTPVIHSHHVLEDNDIVRAYARYPEVQVVASSHYQRRALGDGSSLSVIHHGIDTDGFPFNPASGDYLVYMGRIMARKGPVEAIHLARQIGMRLIMAGPAQDDYFRAEIAPLVDGKAVEYVGPVDTQKRNNLLAGAAALLYPVLGAETFGLVMVEAMACGTPVVALEHGPVPEIVENGVTGYYARELESLAKRIPAALELNRARIRQEAIRRFDYRRMVDDYEALYRRAVRNDVSVVGDQVLMRSYSP